MHCFGDIMKGKGNKSWEMSRKRFVGGVAAGVAGAALAGSGLSKAQVPPMPPEPPCVPGDPCQDATIWPTGNHSTTYESGQPIRTLHVEKLLEYVNQEGYPGDPSTIDTSQFLVECTADVAEMQGAFLRIGRDASFWIRCIDGQPRQFWYAENPFTNENGIPEDPNYNPALLPSMYDETNPNFDENFWFKYSFTYTLILMPFAKPQDFQNPEFNYTPFYFDFAEPVDGILPAVFVDHPKGLNVEGEIFLTDPLDEFSPPRVYSDYHPDLEGDVMKTEIKRGPNCHGFVFTAYNLCGKYDMGWRPPEVPTPIPNPDPNGPPIIFVPMIQKPLKVTFKDMVCTGEVPPPPNTISTMGMALGYTCARFLDLTIVDYYDKGITVASSYFTHIGRFEDPNEPFGPGCKFVPANPNGTGVFWTGMWGRWFNWGHAFYGGKISVFNNTFGKPEMTMFRSIDQFYDDYSDMFDSIPDPEFFPGNPNFEPPQHHLIFFNTMHNAPIGLGFMVKYANDPLKSWLNMQSSYEDPENPGNFLTHGQLFEEGRPYGSFQGNYWWAWELNCAIPECFLSRAPEGPLGAWLSEESNFPPNQPCKWTHRQLFDPTGPYGLYGTDYWRAWGELCENPSPEPCYMTSPPPGPWEREDWLKEQSGYSDEHGMWTHRELFVGKNIEGGCMPGPYEIYGDDYYGAWHNTEGLPDSNCPGEPECYLNRPEPLSEWQAELSQYPTPGNPPDPNNLTHRQLFLPAQQLYYDEYGPKYQDAWDVFCGEVPPCYFNSPPPPPEAPPEQMDPWLDSLSKYPNGLDPEGNPYPDNWTHRELMDGKEGEPAPYQIYRGDLWLAYKRSCGQCYLIGPPPEATPVQPSLRTYVSGNEIIGDFAAMKNASVWCHGENCFIQGNNFHGQGTGVVLWRAPLEPDQPYFPNQVRYNNFMEFSPKGQLFINGQDVPISAFIWLFPSADSNYVFGNQFGPVGNMDSSSDFAAIWVMGAGNRIGLPPDAQNQDRSNDYTQTGLKGFLVSTTGIVRPGCIVLDKSSFNNQIYENRLPTISGSDICTQILDLTYHMDGSGNDLFNNQHISPSLPCDSDKYDKLVRSLLNYFRHYELIPLSPKRDDLRIWGAEDFL